MKTKKDTGIELARILGSLIVIGCHIVPDVQVNGSFTYGRVVQKVLVGDGVAVFWLIAGMFFRRIAGQ